MAARTFGNSEERMLHSLKYKPAGCGTLLRAVIDCAPSASAEPYATAQCDTPELRAIVQHGQLLMENRTAGNNLTRTNLDHFELYPCPCQMLVAPLVLPRTLITTVAPYNYFDLSGTPAETQLC